MQMNDATELAKHKARCPEGEHTWEKEYFLGAQAGDLVCSKCGASDYIAKESVKEKEDVETQ